MPTRHWPLERGAFTLTSGFGPRWGAQHSGLDLGAPDGTPFYACQAGTVQYIGPADGYGQWIVIDSTDEQGSGCVEYGHMWDAYATGLKVGDHVAAGQLLGYVGSNGKSTGPHLHITVWERGYGGRRIDPEVWLAGARYPNEQPQEEGRSMTLFGVDISNWQDGLNLGQVKAEGFRAVIAKVSEGTGFRDHTWPGFRDAARAAGLPVMGYHYLRADNPIEAQADTFVQHLGDKSIPCMIDAETGSGGAAEVRAFRDAVEARGVRVALLYLPRWYWRDHIGSPDLSGLPPLMASSYGTDQPGYASVLYPGDHDSGWAGYGGLDVAVLQFTQRAQVAGQQIDAWAFRRGDTALADLFGAAPAEGGTVPDIQTLILDQLVGPGGRGWPMLGPSKIDPTRSNTLVEALAEVRNALCVPKESHIVLDNEPPAKLDMPDFMRFVDAATFNTERAVAALTNTMTDVAASVARIEKGSK